MTANDEEPKCNRCDNLDHPYEFCIKYCGSEHFWNGYCRTKKEKEDYKNDR